MMGTGFQPAREDSCRPTDRFRLDNLIGQGGMGAVYKAYDRVLERVVAIKLLHAALAEDESAVARLKREIQLAVRISHPNVIRVYDFGEMHKAHFISMAYVGAPTLRELLRKDGRMPHRRVVRYAVQICRALEAAHQAGVIHRDLKPQNVLVDAEDKVYVTDFGLAKALDEEMSLSSLNQRPGTPSYMSPEQRLGLPTDQRTDIYSFGAVLYEMLTGELLLSAGTAVDPATANPEVSERDPKLISSGAPVELIGLVVRCLRAPPEERYAEASDILAELELMSGAGPEPTTVNLTTAGKRTPPVWVWGVVALLVAATGLIWGFRDRLVVSSEVGSREVISDASDLSALAPYRKAQELLRSPHSAPGLEHSVALLESAVKVNPEFVPAHTAIVEAGLLLYRETADRKWVDRATEAAEAARRLDEELPQTQIALARLNLATGKPHEALDLLKRLVNLNDGSESYRLLSEAYLGVGAPLKAIESGERAVRADPSDWRNHHTLAETFYTLHRLREAEIAYRRALALNPDNADACNNLGAICLQMGMLDEAASLLEKSLKLCPKPETYSNIGTAYFLGGRYQLAVMAFEKAVSLRPGSYVLMGNLAVAYRLAGQESLAATRLERAIDLAIAALEINPKDRAAKRRLAVYHARSENATAADALVTELLQEAPGDVQVLYTDAVVRLLGGRRSGAVETLGRALRAGYPAALAFADPTWRPVAEHPRFRELRETYSIRD